MQEGLCESEASLVQACQGYIQIETLPSKTKIKSPLKLTLLVSRRWVTVHGQDKAGCSGPGVLDYLGGGQNREGHLRSRISEKSSLMNKHEALINIEQDTTLFQNTRKGSMEGTRWWCTSLIPAPRRLRLWLAWAT